MKKLLLLLLLVLLPTSDGQQTVPFATGAVASGTVNPAPVSGATIWFSADCITYVGSVCGVPANGTSITSWSDRSGNANNMTVAGGTATFNTLQVNGQPAVTLASSFKGNLATVVTASNGHTAFVVYQTSGTGQLEAWGAPVSGFGNSVASTNAAQVLYRQNTSNVGIATNHVSAGVWTQINVAMTNAAGGFAISFRMSSAVDVLSSSTSSSITANGPSTVGYDPVGTPSAFFTGQIAEIMYYNQTLTLAQIQQNEAYFRWKYGIS